MNYLPISIAAYLLNSVSILANKFLLTKSVQHPLAYVFYISASSLLALLVIPYLFFTGTPIPDSNTLALASISTLSWTIGAYFLFAALRSGLADRVSPIIGTLTPIFLLIYYYLFSHSISLNETWGASLMTGGLLVLILPYLRSKPDSHAQLSKTRELFFEIMSGLFFAISYILLKEVYNHTDFLSGLAYSKLILLPLILIILFVPALKRTVFTSNKDKFSLISKTGLLFIGSQIAGGASQVLISLGISLANPALVNSLQGVQYAFLFIFSLLLANKFPKIFTERLTKKLVLQNTIGILLIAGGLYMLAFANTQPKNATLGVTYSPRYAQTLGLNPKTTYIQVLDDLNLKTVRLPVYWDQIQKDPGHFDFTELDYYFKQAEQRKVKVTLVIGYKVPRYPECYIPSWASKYTKEQFDMALYQELQVVADHYKNSPAMDVWQIENEPLFPFGVCPKVDFNRLKQEVATVHRADPKHQVMITESGEFGLWLTTAKTADIVGTTLYRRTLAPYLPEFKSPLPPFFYQFKAMTVRFFHPGKKIYVSELQAEPWSNSPLQTTTYSYQTKAFPLADLEDNVKFSKEAGFDTIYLWGVEWWYYLKAQGHPEYTQKAVLIFNDLN
jgi:drug/metabolite transporter (DMT)-like permease